MITDLEAEYKQGLFHNSISDDIIIEGKDLTKQFVIPSGSFLRRKKNIVTAVEGVNFILPRGKSIGLVGESGCGKTTTAKMILHLEEPTKGEILFRGVNISDLHGNNYWAYRRSVQAVFQDPYSSLNPRLTIGKIVGEPLIESNQQLSKIELRERVSLVLDAVGLLPALATHYPHELSGGQRQRVAIARALSTNPDCIILDEPVSALDVSIRAQLINLLRTLQDQLHVSYLLIAHDLAVVKYLVHEIGVMYLGRLVERCSSEEIISHPVHPYTQILISNALPSHPDEIHEERILAGEVPSLLNPPSGCHFHPRCPLAKAICRDISPQRKQINPRHSVVCHYYQNNTI